MTDKIEAQQKLRQRIDIMQTLYTDCDICKAESIQHRGGGRVTGEVTLTIMNGMDRVLTLCHDCWFHVDVKRQRPTRW